MSQIIFPEGSTELHLAFLRRWSRTQPMDGNHYRVYVHSSLVDVAKALPGFVGAFESGIILLPMYLGEFGRTERFRIMLLECMDSDEGREALAQAIQRRKDAMDEAMRSAQAGAAN